MGDLRALLESGESPATLEAAGVISVLEVRGSPKEVKSIRDRLMKILKECTDSRGEPGLPGLQAHDRLLPARQGKTSH